jgi:hypothetical protein
MFLFPSKEGIFLIPYSVQISSGTVSSKTQLQGREVNRPPASSDEL